jgi:putative transcriptional regulator
MDRLKGRLLVATPILGDPNFDRTVILMIEHTDDGALGLVLNRPSGLEVGEPLPEWRPYTGDPDVVFIGGPVSRSSVIALARVAGDAPATSWEQVLGPVGVVDLSHDPDAMAGTLAAVRVFAGYAGWGPGQLEMEIAEGAWFVVTADPGDVFTDSPEQLWRRVLARQPGELAKVALVPEDPRLN